MDDQPTTPPELPPEPDSAAAQPVVVGYDSSGPVRRPGMRLAVWSLVVGMLGLCLGPVGILTGMFAISLGIRAMRRGTDSSVRACSIIGIAAGCLMPLALVMAILLPTLERNKALRMQAQCDHRLRAIERGISQYIADHNRYPADLDALLAEGMIVAEDLDCPANLRNPPGRYDYFYAPPASDAADFAVMVCEVDDEHHRADGTGTVLVDGSIDRHYHIEDELDESWNADFKAAYVAAGHRP